MLVEDGFKYLAFPSLLSSFSNKPPTMGPRRQESEAARE